MDGQITDNRDASASERESWSSAQSSVGARARRRHDTEQRIIYELVSADGMLEYGTATLVEEQ